MPKHPAAAVLATLRKQLSETTEPLERDAIKTKIRDVAHIVAKHEYRAKSAALLRNMAGAY
jgi:hypothetical protein